MTIAIEIAENAEPGSVILCMLPDTGERYLSSPLFEGIEEDMTEDEVAKENEAVQLQLENYDTRELGGNQWPRKLKPATGSQCGHICVRVLESTRTRPSIPARPSTRESLNDD